MVGTGAFLSIAWPTGVQLLVFFCSSVSVGCSTPQGSLGVGRNTFLSSLHLCFIIVLSIIYLFPVMIHWWVRKPSCGPNNCMFWTEAEGEIGYPKNRFKPPSILILPFQGGTSVVVPYCYLFLLSVFIKMNLIQRKLQKNACTVFVSQKSNFHEMISDWMRQVSSYKHCWYLIIWKENSWEYSVQSLKPELVWVHSWEMMADATSLTPPSSGLSETFPNKSVEHCSPKNPEMLI